MRNWVSFEGDSMAPGLRAGDRLLVEAEGKGPWRVGDVIITGPFRLEGRRVWSAHRVHRRDGRLATKGDRAPHWDPPAEIVGKVVGFRRGGWEVIWGERGQTLKAVAAWLSSRVVAGPKGRPARWGLRLVSALEWILQLGMGHVRYHAV